MNKYSEFKALHWQKQPLILGNVWNVQSAKICENLNFQAIGTSSAAIAHSLGYEDGQQMPFSDLLFIVEKINKHSTLPFSVDIEFGYGNTATKISENIIKLIDLGVAGINIEDSFMENNERKLQDKFNFFQLLHEIKKQLSFQKKSIFINVRCDAFLLNAQNPLTEAKERIKMYEEAGADGIFLPNLSKEKDIQNIIEQTNLPINVMCMPDLPNFENLKKQGVKRISMGNFLHNYTYNSLEKMMDKFLSEQSFNVELTKEIMYQAIIEKDTSFEGLFFTAVKTTGIFCRPSCTARKPKIENVEFLKTSKECILKGYRACKVCHPLDTISQMPIEYKALIDELTEDPTLKFKDFDLKLKGIEPSINKKMVSQK